MEPLSNEPSCVADVSGCLVNKLQVMAGSRRTGDSTARESEKAPLSRKHHRENWGDQGWWKHFIHKQLKQHKQKGEAGRRAYFLFPKTKKRPSLKGDGEPVLLMGPPGAQSRKEEFLGLQLLALHFVFAQKSFFSNQFSGCEFTDFSMFLCKEAIKRKGGS